jgi:hypothetical protein
MAAMMFLAHPLFAAGAWFAHYSNGHLYEPPELFM